MRRLRWIGLAVGLAPLAAATTKGLNQIVTPDIQPFGQLSVSFQAQHSMIGNPYQSQYEVGLSKEFEVAAFQSLQPGSAVLNAELGIVQRPDWLLSVGFLGWNTRGGAMQPFVEGGYYKGLGRLIGGFQRIGSKTSYMAGASYQATPRATFAVDYLSGSANFVTFGMTYNVTNNVTINPAIYVSNAPGHKAYPFAVMTWTVTAWK